MLEKVIWYATENLSPKVLNRLVPYTGFLCADKSKIAIFVEGVIHNLSLAFCWKRISSFFGGGGQKKQANVYKAYVCCFHRYFRCTLDFFWRGGGISHSGPPPFPT